MKKRALSLILALVLVVGLLPTVAFAAGGNEAEIVGGSQYETLQEAVNAAENGDTVRVLRDIVVDPDEVKDWTTQDPSMIGWTELHPYCIIDKELTLDLNGKTISYEQKMYTPDPSKAYNNSTNFYMFLLVKGANLTVLGNGTLDGSMNAAKGEQILNTTVFRLHNDANAKLTIENGTFVKNRPDIDYRGKSAVEVVYIKNNGGEVLIKGGRFENLDAKDGHR